LVLILAFIVTALVQSGIRKRSAQAAARELADSFKPLAIAPEDFFLPEEPDLLPEFIPQRPQRDSWTAADAAPYWTDPLEGNEKRWRNRGSAVIDNLMETIP
jgi:hypothetical protein